MSTKYPVRRKNTIAVSGTDTTHKPPESEFFESATKTFLRNCKLRNLSSSTITYYVDVLKMLTRLMNGIGVQRPLDVTHEHIHEAIIIKRNEGVKDATIDKYMRGWRAFFNFMETEGFLPTNPFDKVAIMKSEKRIIETFSKPQIKALLESQKKTTFTGYRNYVLMLLLLETGVRVSEAAAIKVTDINWKERLIKVYGKGRKERYVPFQKTLERHLNEYVSIRGFLEHDFLFVNIDNTPLKVRTMQEVIAQAGKDAKVTGVRVSPHTFRHTMAKMYVMNGGDPLSLQLILGHTSLEMCRNYVRLFSSDVAIKHARHSPLENMDNDY